MRKGLRRLTAIVVVSIIIFGGFGTYQELTASNITPEEAAALRNSFFLDNDGNVFRELGDSFFLMTDAHVHHELARLGLREPLPPGAAPPWDASRYSNQNRHNVQTNFALRNALVDFYLMEAPYFDNPFPWDWTIPTLSHEDLQLSANFTTIFMRAFRNDTFSRTLPLNADYLEGLLRDINFYFSTVRNRWYWNGSYFDFKRYDYPHSGFFYHRGSVVFVAATVEWSDVWGYNFVFGDRFARTAIHEVGHVLGLGESLAHLFEEKFMGLDAPLRPGNWERDSSFDRVLLALAGYDDFWRAALTSNAAYGNLWNMHLGHVINFTDLQRARGVARYMRAQGRLPQEYEDAIGMFYRAFLPDTPDATRRAYITQIQTAVTMLNNFATEHNLQTAPIQAVFDGKIGN